jgi:molecular chaperone GrpE
VTAAQGSPGAPQGSPGTPGPEAEDVPVDSKTKADSSKVDADIDAMLADTQQQRDEYLELAQRTKADFDNYRKRVAREQSQLYARAGERVVARLLPVLDDLVRALEAAEHHEEAKVLEGVRMTKDALAGVLASEGVEEIPTDGAFDPHVHEALMTQPADGVEPGHIVQVIQRGYRLGDVVLRPARVIVAEG